MDESTKKDATKGLLGTVATNFTPANPLTSI